jgi:hypothetical protein
VITPSAVLKCQRARPNPSRISRPLLLLLLGRLGLGLSLLLSLLDLLGLSALRVPLSGLEDEHADEHERKDGVARGQDLEAVLAPEDNLTLEAPLARVLPLLLLPDAVGDGAQAAERVGSVDGEGDEVEDEGGAVEEEVGLAGAPHLDKDADEDGEEHDVQDTADERGRFVDELEVRLVLVQVGRSGGVLGPEEREVVGKHGEEDTEEEEGRYVIKGQLRASLETRQIEPGQGSRRPCDAGR